MTKQVSIKDIYVGKPDAKDEIHFEGIDGFVKSFVAPENFNIDSLLQGNHCFITGYKGTGKTALLFYLEHLIREKAPYACCSFIFFKDEFTETYMQKLEGISQRIVSSIKFENDTLKGALNFEYVWRWLILKHIVADQEYCNDGIFETDDNWYKFKETIDKIKAPQDKRKVVINPKIKITSPYEPNPNADIEAELEIDLSQMAGNYSKFTELIDIAEQQLSVLKRTETPYYIFIDELEAYFGEEDIFKRDLCFIRDLLFTVKRFNSILINLGKGTKIICSARVEIINAINRFVVSRELNKVTNGFEVPLVWNYSNTISYQHPIIQILLKRIHLSEEFDVIDYKDIYERWFPEKIHGNEPAGYILNNAWNKPRDIVRLISAAQSTYKSNETVFNQSVFVAMRKKYSTDSLIEIKEELRALYSEEDIDTIVSCFTGFREKFTLKHLTERVQKQYKNSILEEKLNPVLQDLYRLGFLGNYHQASRTHRWQHKGDEGLIISDDWRIEIHSALCGALSLNSKFEYSVLKSSDIEVGEVVKATVVRVLPHLAVMEIDWFGKKYRGGIHISKFGEEYIPTLIGVVQEGDEFAAQVIGYNSKYKSWNLTLEGVVQDVIE